MNGVIGIFDYTTAHSAGVIGKDAAYHTGIDRGGVGSDSAAIQFQDVVDESANDARLKANQVAMIFHAVISPMFRDVHQNPIRHGLTREARPTRAEGHRDLVLLCEFE